MVFGIDLEEIWMDSGRIVDSKRLFCVFRLGYGHSATPEKLKVDGYALLSLQDGQGLYRSRTSRGVRGATHSSVLQ